MGEIFQNTLLNISVLVLIAYVMTKLTMVQHFIGVENYTLGNKIGMGILFGVIGIISTYLGIPVEGAIANSRVIGVVTGGVLGGPVVGIIAAVIAGFHRYAIDIGGFTAVACMCSTLAGGILSGLFSKVIRRGNHQWVRVGLLTIFAESLQMGIILLIARPFERALVLVEIVALPMIVFNACGVVLFLGVFDSVFIEQDRQAAKRVGRVLSIADMCLPYFQAGLYSSENMHSAAQMILEQAGLTGAAITDKNSFLGWAGSPFVDVTAKTALPEVVRSTLETGVSKTAQRVGNQDLLHPHLRKNIALCAPLIQRGNEVIGTIVILTPQTRLSKDVEYRFVEGLAQLLSTQLELSQLEIQKKLRRKAEIMALQSQINPHFLFNALSTISMFCREKPERARELLLELSNYFRNTLKNEKDMVSLYEEMNHIHAYLELEKARFGDKLQVEEEIPEGIVCMVPTLLVQPLVENAIRHGNMKEGQPSKINIQAVTMEKETCITITDNGVGISDEIIVRLYNNSMGEAVGLSNVHRRLQSIYGKEYGLRFHNKAGENSVIIRIPKVVKSSLRN